VGHFRRAHPAGALIARGLLLNIEDPERHLARIGNLSVLFVMATEQEYGPHLRSRIDPLITGVGPVEAAASAGATLAALAHRRARPDLVFTLGSAGSRSLEHAAVYQVASVAYRDMDCSPLGFERGLTPFLDEPAVIAIPHVIPGVAAASLSSGANIVSGAAYDAVGADMVDMESFAVLRAARRFQVPMVGLRGITDGRAELTGLHDWTEYLHIVDKKLASVLDRFGEGVASGTFTLPQSSRS
jgi:adenosylhomocysteine nucleosidase